MARTDFYTDLSGRNLSLSDLDAGERKLVTTLRRRAKARPDWNDFDSHWLQTVGQFYAERGLTRRQTAKTTPFLIAQDLSSRLAVSAGMARMPDYRDELDELIRTRFATRRAFCRATGLSEDMLSHVLSKRKHLSIDALTQALEQIGYTLHIAPLPEM